jgi:hypothetical protein
MLQGMSNTIRWYRVACPLLISLVAVLYPGTNL